MIYKVLEVILIFLAGKQVDGGMDVGVPRGPRGPKNVTKEGSVKELGLRRDEKRANENQIVILKRSEVLPNVRLSHLKSGRNFLRFSFCCNFTRNWRFRDLKIGGKTG